MNQRKIILSLLYNNFEMLDLFGPLEMFGLANNQMNKPVYDIVTISEKDKLIKSSQGPYVLSDLIFQDFINESLKSNHFEHVTLFIPGGKGAREEIYNQEMLEFIEENVVNQRINRIFTVCTGSAILSKTSLLDNLDATSNKLSFDWVTKNNESVNWLKKARFVKSTNSKHNIPIYTSSGISAGIDLSLAMIQEDFDKKFAQSIANRAEYANWNSNPLDDPFEKI